MQKMLRRGIVLIFMVCCAARFACAQQSAPLDALHPHEGDFVMHDFKFADGKSLSEVRLHYTTLGEPQRDSSGRVNNAVLILHGTNRRGGVFLVPSFAGVLFGAPKPTQ